MVLFILFFVLPLPMLIWFFIRSKNRKTKWVIGFGMVLFVAFLSLMTLGLWALDIEDFYGNKNEIYWEGSSGDSIKLIDDNTKQVLATGILEKTWHRINIKTNQKEIDILAWLENETGDEYSDTRIEFKDGKILIFVLNN